MLLKLWFDCVLLLLLALNSVLAGSKKNELIVVTVATHVTDGFARFNRSMNVYGYKLEILGLNHKWNGGDITRSPGGGQKVNLLKKYLYNFRDRDDVVILFTDSYDVIVTDKPSEMMQRFESFNTSVVFSSEKFCWPDKTLEKEYPQSDGKRYLNSGAFMGRASSIYTIVTNQEIEDNDDDQLYYTKVYLNSKLRESIGIKLDLLSFMFQNLNGALNEVEIRFTESAVIDKSNGDAYLYNKVSLTTPILIHGNGDSKVPLNSLGNYLAKSWHPATNCLSCSESILNFDNIEPSNYPHVLLCINIFKATPFLPEFLEDVSLLNYPKDKITLFMQTSVDVHLKELQEFVDNFKTHYGLIVYHFGLKKPEWILRNRCFEECLDKSCDYIFVVDSEARLTNPETLLTLMEANKPVVAPMLVRHKQYWSNFWGALTQDGFYSRSHDYLQIVQSERRGIWNVPYISSCYLMNASLLDASNRLYNHKPLSYGIDQDDQPDPDMFFCRRLRENGVFMYVDNMDYYGHLAFFQTYDVKRKNADFYEIESNHLDWRRRYIHENYSQLLSKSPDDIEQPCPDVYWFPLVSPVYCRHLIEIMENYGQWSEGKNQDPRLEGGYESVPTRDIHMKQVDLEPQWLYFLKEYIGPIQEKVFLGYVHNPPKAIMNFVVRYHPAEQAFLKPHHDASTYTINIALNQKGIDYEGGGCRFIRYNCSLTNLRLGWSLIHPGRLTHYHEGLTVTKGVRYIMVSFVDP